MAIGDEEPLLKISLDPSGMATKVGKFEQYRLGMAPSMFAAAICGKE